MEKTAEEKKVSVQEMLQITIDEINALTVPIAYADEIARPLCRVIANLKLCIEAFDTPKNDQPKEGDENVVGD